MSFILDALRKLEQERHQGAVSGVSSAPAAVGRRRSWAGTIGTMAAIAVASGFVTAVVLRMTAPAQPPEIAETGSEVEAASSSPERGPLAERVAAEPERHFVEPHSRRAEPPPVARETAPPGATGDDTISAEPAPSSSKEAKEAMPPNIRLVGRDSPVRVATSASEPPLAAVEPEESFPRLILQGTSVLDGEPVAVISDRRVFEGDHIEGALVIRIGERVVELEFEGRRFTISL
jgi:hypothetical protein